MNEKILQIKALIALVDRDFANWVVSRLNRSNVVLSQLTAFDFFAQADEFYKKEYVQRDAVLWYIGKINPNLSSVLSYDVLVDIYKKAKIEALKSFFVGGGKDKLKEIVQWR